MKQVYVVRTTEHPHHAWAFTSEARARRLLETLQGDAGATRATLTTAPLNPSASSHMRCTVDIGWNGAILSATKPEPRPTEPAHPALLIRWPQITGPLSEPWATCTMAARAGRRGREETREEAETIVSRMKTMGLWPTSEQEARDMNRHYLNARETPRWLATPPDVPTEDTQPGILSGLVLCPHCCQFMEHKEEDNERYYRCPETGWEDDSTRPRVKAEYLERITIVRVHRRRAEDTDILELAVQAETAGSPTDQPELNAILAREASQNAEEILGVVGRYYESTSCTMTELREYTERLTQALEQAAQMGNSPARAIAGSGAPENEHRNIALQRHVHHCLAKNPTQANRRAVGDIVRIIDPSPDHETITWRLTGPSHPLLVQPMDRETTLREVDQEIML